MTRRTGPMYSLPAGDHGPDLSDVSFSSAGVFGEHIGRSLRCVGSAEQSTAFRKAHHLSEQSVLFSSMAGSAQPDLPKVARTGREIQQLSSEDIEVDLSAEFPKTWPPRYRMHKYWGRKPSNIVSRHIEYFTAKGDFVLDPFVGSGVSVVEAARLERRALGLDFNPVAVRLCRALLNPPRTEAFRRSAEEVVAANLVEMHRLFRTSCRRCGKKAVIRSSVYEAEELIEVRYKCAACGGSGAKRPSAQDVGRASKRYPAPRGTPDGAIFPGWQMRKLQRLGLERWRELFTARNYRLAGLLRRSIERVEDERSREWLFLTLTSSLAQFSRMIADFSGRAGGPSWKINCYWIPKKSQELNPLWYFQNRVNKSLSAIEDLRQSAPLSPYGACEQRDSRFIPLRDHSVDFVFADPPYGGEGIQYGELSMLWALWLREEVPLEEEIAFNPVRDLSESAYEAGLAKVFEESFRVLRPGRWMTVTFANRNLKVWNSLVSATREAGFKLVTVSPIKRSAPALTETTMRQAPKTDLVLSFQRPVKIGGLAVTEDPRRREFELRERVAHFMAALRFKGKSADAHSVFDCVLTDWLTWYYREDNRKISVKPTLNAVTKILSTLEAS